MEIEINKELIIIYLEKYYREQLDFNGNVKINLGTKREGYYGDKVNVVDIGIEGFVKLADKDVPCVVKIGIDDMKNIITYYLKEQGYDVLKIENNIVDEHEYGCCHETVKKFKGVKVKVKKNNKLLVKKREDDYYEDFKR
jgi:hypothetical protein